MVRLTRGSEYISNLINGSVMTSVWVVYFKHKLGLSTDSRLEKWCHQQSQISPKAIPLGSGTVGGLNGY